MSVRVSPTATLIAIALGCAGCGQSTPRLQTSADVRPPPAIQPAIPLTISQPVTPAIPDGAAVTIAALMDLAIQANPNRYIFEANRAAAAAAVTQAGAWANPELELSAGRATARQSNDDGVRTTTTVGGIELKQRFELAGKRSARIAAAESERTVTERDIALDRLDLDVEVRTAALAVASADARVTQAQRDMDLSAQVRGVVERRVQAGETDHGDLARARVDFANAQLIVDAAAAEASATRTALRTWCGDGLPEHFTVTGMLLDAPAAIAVADVQGQAVTTHPRLAMFDAQATARAAMITAEERAWYPDLTLGVSGNRESDTNALGVSVGIELPLWNRNEGGIAKARADMARVHAERRREARTLERHVAAAWSNYERERRQIEGLSGIVIPAAQDALTLKLAAFQAGGTTLLDVIDARRAVLTAESAVAASRERAALAHIDLIRAVGTDPITATASPPAVPPTKPSIPAGVQP